MLQTSGGAEHKRLTPMFGIDLTSIRIPFHEWLLAPAEEPTVPLEFEAATDEPESLVGAYVAVRGRWWGVVLAERNGGYSVGQLVQCGGAWFLPQKFERRFVWASEVSDVAY